MKSYLFLSATDTMLDARRKPPQRENADDEKGEGKSSEMEKERIDDLGTIGRAEEPAERDDASLRNESLDPTFGNEGGIGQSIGSGQKKGPSSGFGPKREDSVTDDSGGPGGAD